MNESMLRRFLFPFNFLLILCLLSIARGEETRPVFGASKYSALPNYLKSSNRCGDECVKVNIETIALESGAYSSKGANTRPYIDVRDFGAKGDGVADDTEAIQAAIGSLRTTGGTILMKGNFVSGSLTFPAIAQWLRIELDGTLKLLTTLVLTDYVALVGKGGSYGVVQFQSLPSAGIYPPPGNVPAIKLTGLGNKYLANISILNPTGPGILLQNGAQAYLENVGVLGANLPTSYPIIVDGFFWVWLKNCSFLGRGADASIYFTKTSSSFFDSGLAYIDDSRIAGKGIKVAARVNQNAQGNIIIRNVVYESANNAFLTLDGTKGIVAGIELENVELADPVSIPSLIRVISGPVDSVHIKGDEALFGTNKIVSGDTINGLHIDGKIGLGINKQWDVSSLGNYTAIRGGMLYGQWSGQGATMSPSLVPYATLPVEQDVTKWSSIPGGTATVAPTTAPDGTDTAGKLTCSDGPDSRYLFRQSMTLANGDWFIAGFWIKSGAAAGDFSMSALPGVFIKGGATFSSGNTYLPIYSDSLKQIGASWFPVVVADKITNALANPQSVALIIRCDPTHPTSYWMPFLIRVPAGTLSDPEVQRITKYLTNIPSGAPASSIAMFPHQKLWGANLTSTKGISATNTAANNLRGSIIISGTNSSGTVIFQTAEPDANYFLTVTPTTINGSPAAGSNRVKSISKTATGFTILLEAAPGEEKSVTFDWHLVR
jgi:pectate lyase-like protein